MNEWITTYRDLDVVSNEGMSLAREKDQVWRESPFSQGGAGHLLVATVFFASHKLFGSR